MAARQVVDSRRALLSQENEAVQEEKKKQLYEEGIDAILARAEVVQDTKAEMAERNDELLSSFNVASFKSDEDDQAFWNRLIPVDQRPSKQPEVQADLGIRTARLKFTEDVSIGLGLLAGRTLHELCSLQHDGALPCDNVLPLCLCDAQCVPSESHGMQGCAEISTFLPSLGEYTFTNIGNCVCLSLCVCLSVCVCMCARAQAQCSNTPRCTKAE